MAFRLPLGSPEVEVLVLLLEEGEASATRIRKACVLSKPRWEKLRDWLVGRGLAVVVREVRRGPVVETRFALTEHGVLAARDFQRGLVRVHRKRARAAPASNKNQRASHDVRRSAREP